MTEQVGDDYIVFTQRPNYQAEAGWKNEGERPAYIQSNKLRFLRPYQLKAIHSLQSAVKDGKDRFLFETPQRPRTQALQPWPRVLPPQYRRGRDAPPPRPNARQWPCRGRSPRRSPLLPDLVHGPYRFPRSPCCRCSWYSVNSVTEHGRLIIEHRTIAM
jgi:hypothetical protein